METLAYLHLALANEAPASTDYEAEKTSRERPQLFAHLNSLHLPTSATVHLLSLTVALGILGMARQASALVKQGESGPEVTALQQRLQELGYFQAKATGYFGSVTKAAVMEFQQAKGLTPDGVVGRNTEASLRETSKSSSEPVSESSKDTIKIGDRGEAVTVVQKRLAEIGIRSGEEGVFDEATQEAVRQFQQGQGLTVDGIVGQQTLAALPQIGESKLPAVDESQAMPAPKETLKSPAVDEAQPTPATKQTTKWYEDNSAPLTPFTK
ncbi:MAG: peptidoglycan-binding protein [Cyanobacteriota bacterium]|nr:peptidoglycan-binding protein [Cyanobacteriota bacterium]